MIINETGRREWGREREREREKKKEKKKEFIISQGIVQIKF